jgi:hypothetical protein
MLNGAPGGKPATSTVAQLINIRNQKKVNELAPR